MGGKDVKPDIFMDHFTPAVTFMINLKKIHQEMLWLEACMISLKAY